MKTVFEIFAKEEVENAEGLTHEDIVTLFRIFKKMNAFRLDDSVSGFMVVDNNKDLEEEAEGFPNFYEMAVQNFIERMISSFIIEHIGDEFWTLLEETDSEKLPEHPFIKLLKETDFTELPKIAKLVETAKDLN